MENKNITDKEHVEIEIIEEKKQNEQIVNKEGWLKTILSYKPVLYLFSFVAIFVAIIISKDYIFSIIAKNEYSKVVHSDQSFVKAQNNFDDEENVRIAKGKLTNKVEEIIEKIENKKIEQSKLFEEELTKTLDKEFGSSYKNIPLFADWFYLYTTQYKILVVGARGIIDKYRGIMSDASLTDAASMAISDYMATHYKDIVLRPHLLEPSLKISLEKLIDKYMNDKNLFVQKLDTEFKEYISNNNIDLSKISYETIYIDWESNIANSRNLITYKDKDAAGGVTITGSAAALSHVAGSKISSGTAGKAFATKIVGKMGIKKLAAIGMPKLISIAAGTATFGVGTAIGFGVDYLINEGDEALFRKSFESDAYQNLDNVKNNIFEILKDSEIVESTYERDINIYKKFINKR